MTCTYVSIESVHWHYTCKMCLFLVTLLQVWFQNTRAHDSKRQSRPVVKTPGKRNTSGTTTSTSPSTYIPIVPNPYAVLYHHHKLSGTTSCAGKSSPSPLNYSSVALLTSSSEDQPLDLSIRKQQPPRAHEHHHTSQLPVHVNINSTSPEDQVLNLSNKIPKLEPVSPAGSVKLESPYTTVTTPNRCSSRESTASSTTNPPQPFFPLSIPKSHFLQVPDPSSKQLPSHPLILSELECLEAAARQVDASRFQHSEIFKYMTQKGLFKSGFPSLIDTNLHRKFSPSVLNPALLAQITGIIPPNNHHPHQDPVKIGSVGCTDINISSPHKSGQFMVF